MTTPSAPLDVAAFAGSLRRASYNRALLRSVQELAPDSLRIRVHTLDDIPLFNQDVEDRGVPPGVERLRTAVGAAHGLLIATPEYNHGTPGVLKNAIDWLSRPPRRSVLAGRPTAILGASPGMTGTARAQSQLRQAFVFTDTPAMLQPEVLVSRAGEKFDGEGRLTDEKTVEFLRRFLAAFERWIRQLRAEVP